MAVITTTTRRIDVDDRSITSLLRNASIQVLGNVGDDASVIAAWSPLIKISTQPTLKAVSVAECRRAWALICSTWRLFLERECLVSAGGFPDRGWVHIITSRADELPFLVCRFEDEPELVVANVSKTLLAAVTTEEDCFYLFAAYNEEDRWVICTESDLRNGKLCGNP
jgi:hypothetical protein